MILLVDDEIQNLESLSALLEKSGYPCQSTQDPKQALEILRNDNSVKLLITDLKMPGSLNGIELLKNARIIRPDVGRILVTAFGTIESTVDAMKSGAFDVLAKPLKIKVLKEKIAALLEQSIDSPPESTAQISEAYAHVLEVLRKAALSEANVLFTGESGTGKSFMAKLLHSWSRRKEASFVALNCAAIPADLLESELFGFEKGAFTGATNSREGKVMSANGGSLLLDEIADLSLPLQAKLLQLLQDKQFFKLGSNKAIQADLRLLSATNRPLEEMVCEKKFREDLLYRLRVVEIHIPPLRKRKQDLFWLIPSLLNKICEKNKMDTVRLTREAFQAVWQWDWPGNIRELENVLEASIVMAAPENLREGFLPASALPDSLNKNNKRQAPINFPDLASLEKKAIQEALLITGGNKKQSAALLGISERTLYRML